MKILYFLTTDIEKVEAVMSQKRYLPESTKFNERCSVKFRIGSKKWNETSLKFFNEKALRDGWIESNKETMEMLGL